MMVIADNHILALFVDSGQAQLLFIVGDPLEEPESIVSPDLENRTSEFNRRLDIPGRREFIQQHGVLWVSTGLICEETQMVVELEGAGMLRSRA